MNEIMIYLQDVLERDVQERGEQPLTNASLYRAINRALETRDEDANVLQHAMDQHFDH